MSFENRLVGHIIRASRVAGSGSRDGQLSRDFNPAKLIDVKTASMEEIDALPEFLRDKLKSSEEYQDRVRGGGPF
jgi:hypothetical protein